MKTCPDVSLTVFQIPMHWKKILHPLRQFGNHVHFLPLDGFFFKLKFTKYAKLYTFYKLTKNNNTVTDEEKLAILKKKIYTLPASQSDPSLFLTRQLVSLLSCYAAATHLSSRCVLEERKSQWEFLPVDVGVKEVNQNIIQRPASQREI